MSWFVKEADPTPANLSGEDINVSAGEIYTSGDIVETTSGNSTTQTLKRTKIKGANISIIAKKNNHLDAAIIDGKNIIMQGDNIQLGTETVTNTHSSSSKDGADGFLGIGKWNKSSNKKTEQQKKYWHHYHCRKQPVYSINEWRYKTLWNFYRGR